MSRTGLIRAALAVLLMGTAVCAPAAVWAAQQTDAQAGAQERAAQVDARGDAAWADAQDADAAVQQADQSSDFVIDEDGVLTAYQGAGGDVVIPDGVTKIEAQAFYNQTSVTSVVIPDSVKEIGIAAFSGCSLSSVDLGHGVEILDTAAFEGLNVDELVIPTSIRKDGGVGGFLGATIDTVIFEEGTEVIPHFMFGNGSTIGNVVIPDGVTEVGYDAFSYVHGLQEIVLPDSVITIERNAFAHMSDLRSVRIPASLGSDDATVISPFKGSVGIESVTFGEGIVSLPDTLFDGAGITELHIPDTVTSIGSQVFTCSNDDETGAGIGDLYLPASVALIDESNTLDGVTVHCVKKLGCLPVCRGAGIHVRSRYDARA